jgi:hypothetical protein
LFIDTNPSDVLFYTSTGWFFSNNILPYSSFTDVSIINIYSYWNSVHPNGPLNYLIYWLILKLLGDSVFAIKSPWLVAEIVISVYLFKIAQMYVVQTKAFAAALIYTLCAPCYYPGLIVGCDELITSALALMGIYFVLNRRSGLAGLCLSLGFAYKLYPIFFFPAIFIYFQNRKCWKELGITIFIFLLTYTTVAFIYWITEPAAYLYWNLSQGNRLITISYGYYIQDSWFYRPFVTIFNGGIRITPHFLLELAATFGFIIWDFHQTKKKGYYSEKDLFRSCSYFMVILPLVTLSYNYRYLQWLLPPLILWIVTNNRFQILSDPVIQSISKNRINKGLKMIIFISLFFNYAIVYIYFVQIRLNAYFWNLLGIRAYNNYIFTFLLVFITLFIIIRLFFHSERSIQSLNTITFLQGLSGIFIYYSYQGRQYEQNIEYPFLILFFLVYSISLWCLYKELFRKNIA